MFNCKYFPVRCAVAWLDARFAGARRLALVPAFMLAALALHPSPAMAESQACTDLNSSQWAAAGGRTETAPPGQVNIDGAIITGFDLGETIDWSAFSSDGDDDGNLAFSIGTENDLWDDVTNLGGNFATSGSEEFVGANPGDRDLWINWLVDNEESIGSVTIQVTCIPVTPAPVITDITPSAGPTAGGTVVTITGTDLTGATALTFGGDPAQSFTVDSPTQITATTPAHAAGMVDVVVTTPGGSDTVTNGFTFAAAPTLASVTPNTGSTAGGTSVTITGTDLTGATALTFGGTSATSFTVDSPTQITATTPAHAAGMVDVEVTTPGGSATLTDGFTFEIPTPALTSVTPNTGSTAGGTSVTIIGTDLTGATALTFGGTSATSFTVDSPTQITATTPAHAAGMVDVEVTTPGGSATLADGFTFVIPAPALTSVTPNTGSTAGGTSVTIAGSGLTGATAVTFGGDPAQSFTVDSDGVITATTPPHAAGMVDVEVTTPGGSATLADGFEFIDVPAPTITGIAPTSGPVAGGTMVTITGTDLTGASGVTFGGTPAQSFTVDSPTQITATTPPHAAGTVDVAVTTPAGTATFASGYTYEAPVRPDPTLDPEVVGLLTAQTMSASRLAQGQLKNFQDRLEQLHQGGGSAGIDVSFGYGRIAPPNAASQEIDRMIAASHAAVSDGATKPAPGVLAYGPPADPLAALADAAPFALWTGGFVNFGFSDGGIDLDHTMAAVSAGLDYRFSDHFVGGIGIGYGRDHTDIGSNGTQNVGSAYSAAIYGSLEPVGGLFIDGVIGASLLDFDSRRYVTATGEFATGSRGGRQVFASLSAAYELSDGQWLLSPYARAEMARSWLDGFTESGGGLFSLTYGDQTVDVLSGVVGVRAQYGFETEWGTLTPGVRAEYIHDFQGGSSVALGYADLGGLPYVIDIAPDSQDRAALGLSVDMDFAGGASLGFEYSTSLTGWDNLDHTIGLKVTDRF